MPKLQALVKAVVACSFHDKAMMKYLLNYIKKLPKDAFVDDGSYTFRATQAQMDLMDTVIQEGAEWLADFNNATNSGTDSKLED